MIRVDRVTKAYANMKPEELAAIAFQFLADTNEKELDSVRGAVPWKSYKALDYDFRTRYDNLFHMASFFALEYWKSTAMWFAAMAQSAESLRQNNADNSGLALDAAASYRVRLVSLAQAMETVCEELGIEPASVWKIAGADKQEMPCAGVPSPVWLADYTACLRAMATGTRDRTP
jgi:hypothetical protein